MTVTHYMGLCAVKRAECLAALTNAQLMEFGRKFWGDVPHHMEHRAAMHMGCIIEALCDELQAALKKIERLEAGTVGEFLDDDANSKEWKRQESLRIKHLDKENEQLFMEKPLQSSH